MPSDLELQVYTICIVTEELWRLGLAVSACTGEKGDRKISSWSSPSQARITYMHGRFTKKASPFCF